MSFRPTYQKGAYNVICDRCGVEYKSYELRKTWDNLMVCTRGCFEVRQPQDFVRGVADIQAPPWTRPELADTFIASVTIWDPVDPSDVLGTTTWDGITEWDFTPIVPTY